MGTVQSNGDADPTDDCEEDGGQTWNFFFCPTTRIQSSFASSSTACHNKIRMTTTWPRVGAKPLSHWLLIGNNVYDASVQMISVMPERPKDEVKQARQGLQLEVKARRLEGSRASSFTSTTGARVKGGVFFQTLSKKLFILLGFLWWLIDYNSEILNVKVWIWGKSPFLTWDNICSGTKNLFLSPSRWQGRGVAVCVVDGWCCHNHQWRPPTKWNLLNRQSSFPWIGYKFIMFQSVVLCNRNFQVTFTQIPIFDKGFYSGSFTSILWLEKWKWVRYQNSSSLGLTSSIWPFEPCLLASSHASGT